MPPKFNYDMYVYYKDLLPHVKKVEVSDFFGILERSWGFTWKDILDKSHGNLAVVFLLSFLWRIFPPYLLPSRII